MSCERRLVVGVVVLLAGWAVRVAVIGAHALHPDEALYGYWGLLIWSGRDPWLATVPVYKPPLLPYLTAGSMGLLWGTELGVRLPGLVAGTLTIGLTGRLAWRLYRDDLVAGMAMLGIALSPLALLLSATGFTDPPMVALGVAGCVAAAEGRPVWAGALAGLACAAKQTGLVWLPVVGWLLLVAAARGTATNRVWFRWGAGFLAIFGLVSLWDWARIAQGAASFWTTSIVGYGGLRLSWPAEQAPRLQAWLAWARYLLGSLPLTIGLLVGAVALVGRGVRFTTWPALFDLVFTGFALTYLLVHWLWAFPVWDRYLLPLAVPAALLLGRTTSCPRRRWSRIVLSVSVALLLGLASWQAVAGEIPVGAGLPVYDGIDRVADFLEGLPEGSVLYHHWLGWEYAFYLFDGPLYLAYWPSPSWLARDVLAHGEASPRYLVVPAWEPAARVEAALARVGYGLVPVFHVWAQEGQPRFVVYRIARRLAEGPLWRGGGSVAPPVASLSGVIQR